MEIETQTELTEAPSSSGLLDDSGLLPLVNVVFLLLLFILMTGSISEIDAGRVAVPESVNNNESKLGEWRISMSQDGRLRLNGEPVQLDDALVSKITAGLDVGSDGPQPMVTVRADAAVAMGQLATLLDVLKQAGVRSAKLITVRENQRDQ